MAGGGFELQTTSPTKSRRDGCPLAISMCLPFKLYHESLYITACVLNQSTFTSYFWVVENVILECFRGCVWWWNNKCIVFFGFFLVDAMFYKF